MDDDLFEVAAIKHADRLHQRATLACPVAGSLVIDVRRVQAHRAMVALLATSRWFADERLAVAALERLADDGAAFFACFALDSLIEFVVVRFVELVEHVTDIGWPCPLGTFGLAGLARFARLAELVRCRSDVESSQSIRRTSRRRVRRNPSCSVWLWTPTYCSLIPDASTTVARTGARHGR